MNAQSHSTSSSSTSSTETDCKKTYRKIEAKEVRKYLPLVHKIANKIHQHSRKRTDISDLVGWGTAGLIEAMHRYNPTQGAALATFAYYRIHGAIIDGIGKSAPLTRAGYKAAGECENNLAVFNVEISPDYIKDQRNCGRLSPYDFAKRKQISRLLEEAINTLTEQQQIIVRMHYYQNTSLQDAGTSMGYTKSWSSRKHAKALKNLRTKMASHMAC